MGKYFLKKYAKNVFWNVYGRTIRNPGLPSHVKSVLFVCKGNICRSPFAEKITAKYSNFPNQLISRSAGIRVEEPKPPTAEAILTAKRFGVDLQDHKSMRINYGLMETHDLIIAMETWQYRYLRKIFLEFRGKIILLPLFEKYDGISMDSYSIYNIKDPYGKDMDVYNECFRRIDKCIGGLFNKITMSKQRIK